MLASRWLRWDRSCEAATSGVRLDCWDSHIILRSEPAPTDAASKWRLSLPAYSASVASSCVRSIILMGERFLHFQLNRNTPKGLRYTVTGPHRFSQSSLSERSAISRSAGSFHRREVAPGKRRVKDRLERLCCSQRRRSIRFAKENRRLENHRLRKPLRPMADHN